MARKLIRMTRRSHRIFSWPAIFHCQSGRFAMSTRAMTKKTSDPMLMTTKKMKKKTKRPIPSPVVSATGMAPSA